MRPVEDTIREITLNVEQYYAQQVIDPETRFAMPPRVRADYDIHVGMVLVRAIQDVLIQRECVAEYPADWWEALKERFAPKWFLRRYPVLKSRIDMEVLYPRIAIPRERPTMRIRQWTPTDWLPSYTK